MTDDDDMGDMWREIKSISKLKRASNREYAPAQLFKSGILCQQKNDGAHLIVYHRGGMVDFWPGTGLWIVRGQQKKNRGIRALISYCNKLPKITLDIHTSVSTIKS